MLKLKNKYNGKNALLIFGGPSILENGYDLSLLNSLDNIVFLESKALTPKLLESGIKPDYYLMPFPEKSKDNTLQNYIYRSIMGDVGIRPLIKKEYHNEYYDIKDNFQKYFEVWSPKKGLHKAYKWKADVFLKDSPFDLIPCLPGMKLITNALGFHEYFPEYNYQNRVHYYENFQGAAPTGDTDYYDLIEKDGKVLLPSTNYNNSAAIALYRLLYFMGFRKIYFLGMDMSMLGSMEYAANYTYRSMWHFYWYLYKARPAFDVRIKWNFPMYLRPKNNFEEQKTIFNTNKMEFIRIYDKWKYAAKTEYMRTIPFAEYLQNGQN